VADVFDRFAGSAAAHAGRAGAFVLACAVLLAWIISGPLFGFSDTWQLIINTGTTIVTFLMVFLVQHSENKNSRAVQLKLDELIATSSANDRYIAVEDLSDEEITALHVRISKLTEDGNEPPSDEHADDDNADADDANEADDNDGNGSRRGRRRRARHATH
jgi:low affinity Fe/Cu permease